jgi:hypothetical protein
VRTVREQALAGAVRSGLDLLAAGRAALAPQASAAAGYGPLGDAAPSAAAVVPHQMMDWPMLPPPSAAGVTGAGERAVLQDAEPGCGLTRTSRLGTGDRGVVRAAYPKLDD